MKAWMPRIALALALPVLIAANVAAQHYFTSLPAEQGTPAANSAALPTPLPASLADNPRADLLPAETAPRPVRPAIWESLDGHSVQRTGYSNPSENRPAPDRRAAEPMAIAEEPEQPSPRVIDSAGQAGFPPLGRPRAIPRQGQDQRPPSGARSVVAAIGSLAVVLGLFLILAWFLRRAAPASLTALPSDVFEVLGRAPLAGRQQVHLVRCGAKLLLVSVTPDSVQTLAEIEEPDEVTRLAGICKAASPGSATAAFRQVLQQFARQPAENGFIDGGQGQSARWEETQRPCISENLHG